MTTVTYAIKVKPGEPEAVCHISELAKEDKFYLVTKGKRGEILQKALSDPYRHSANPGEEQWRIDCEND